MSPTGVSQCPNCAEPAEVPIVCGRCGWRWYRNPKPAAGTLVQWQAPGASEPAVLLLRRAVEPGLGAWDLPAGYLDPGESMEEAALRETREEAGLRVDLVRLIGVYTSRPGNAVAAVYLARPLEEPPQVHIDEESSDYAWVTRGEVAAWAGRMAFRSMATALEDWAAGLSGLPRAW